MSMPEALRHHVRNCSMQTLGTEPGKSTAARVIAAMASIEVPKGMWSSVATDLLARIEGEASEALKVRRSGQRQLRHGRGGSAGAAAGAAHSKNAPRACTHLLVAADVLGCCAGGARLHDGGRQRHGRGVAC